MEDSKDNKDKKDPREEDPGKSTETFEDVEKELNRDTNFAKKINRPPKQGEENGGGSNENE
jgi:hypothetical protein